MKATAVNKSKNPGHQTRLRRHQSLSQVNRIGIADEGLWIFSLEDSKKRQHTVNWEDQFDCKIEEHELMIDSGRFGHVCPPEFAPQFQVMSSTIVEAVAANNVALQHHGQTVVYGHVTTNSGRRILIQITFDVMSVRKLLLSTSALKHRGVTIIFNHDYDRIIFRNETVNLVSDDCHSYLHITLANGIPPLKAIVMLERMRQMTWMRKSTATMVPRGMRLKKLQLVIDEQSTMRIKPDSLTFLVKRKQQERYVLLNRPQTHTFHSEIGAHSVLRVADEVLRTDEWL